MPRKSKRPCSYPGCPELVDGKYCDHHKREVDCHYNHHQVAPETVSVIADGGERFESLISQLIHSVRNVRNKVDSHLLRKFTTLNHCLMVEHITMKTLRVYVSHATPQSLQKKADVGLVFLFITRLNNSYPRK